MCPVCIYTILYCTAQIPYAPRVGSYVPRGSAPREEKSYASLMRSLMCGLMASLMESLMRSLMAEA